MRRGKILAAVATVLALLAMLTFAVSAEDSVKDGWYNDKGYYEYFENGYQYKDGQYNIDGSYFRFDSDGKMYSNEWYQHPESGERYYYQAGGYRADNCVVKIGDYYYGFDWNGVMYDDTDFSIYSNELEKQIYYKALAGGPLVVNRWIYTEDSNYEQGGYYKYYGADGAAYRGIQEVDGKFYYFYYYGEMATEGEHSFYDASTNSHRSFRVRADGSLYRNEWYYDAHNENYGTWYYYGDDCLVPKGLTTIGSATYYFTEWGGMLANQTYYDGSCSYYADKDGNAVKLNPDAWTRVGDDFYYCVDGKVVQHEIKKIGDSNYYFDYSGKMLKDGEYGIWNDDDALYHIRAKSSGALYCGEWYFEYGRYSYYGYDCKKVEDGFVEIGDSLFYFENGYALRNSILETEDGVVLADSNCVVTICSDGWVYLNDGFYYVEDNRLVRDCITEIGGIKYAFDYDGRMYTKGICWVHNDEGGYGHYLITESGAIVTEEGWKQYEGEWYYVTEGGLLYEGELELYGDTYELRPALKYSDLAVIWDENDTPYLYLVMPDGRRYKVTSDGYYNTGYERVLVENGVIFEGWKQVGASWYYYNPGMITDGFLYEQDDAYYFDNTGVMQANGWIPYYDTYLYANESGRLVDGVVTIGDREYLFKDYQLAYNTYANYDGAYVSDRNALATKIADNGWTSANGYWYYTINGNVKTDNFNVEDDWYFSDDSTGRMISDCERDNCYYDAYGKRYIGWKQIKGSWYYFEPYKVRNGIWKLDGVEYCFDQNGKMLSNTTYFLEYSDKMVVTDANGIVVDRYDVPESIIYQDGSAYMYQDGNSYTGWYGDYYFNYGRMAINQVITYQGEHYYLDNHGKYIRNGWYQRYENWMYADASGALCYDEWLQLGDSWYYFDDYYMVSHGVYYIDTEDKYAEFDENGRFIRYIDQSTGKANSWANIDGKWYYYNSTGTKVTDITLYIDGYWYSFDYEGAMASNDFLGYWNSESDYETLYYYTASGARFEASNRWEIINGDWCYFNADSSVATGWLNISGTRYYIGWKSYYDEATDEETYGLELYTGYRLIDGKVYYFNAGGDLWGEYVGNGWLQLADGDFVYFKDGELLKEGIYNIGGVDYCFYEDGQLLTDGLGYVSNGYNVYASESGALYGAGWHLTDEGWIYVDESGRLYVNGVYQIGSDVYYFFDGYMV
ncbi:MAG: hypothetical protein ACI4FN_04800 [Acutalibacteraceae bacterium]